MTDTAFTTIIDSQVSTIGMKTVRVNGMENITLYTMKESDWLKKLAINFQNVYPQYRVDIVLDNDKTTTTQDKLRNLHAQILAGAGPDILMTYCFIDKTKPVFLEYMIIAIVSTYSVYKCEYLPFHLKEYTGIVGLLLITTIHGYGVIMEAGTVISLFCIIILFEKYENHSIKGKWLNIWLYTFTLCFHICLIRKIYDTFLKQINYKLANMFGRQSIARLSFFVIVFVLFFLFSLGLVFLERKYLKN